MIYLLAKRWISGVPFAHQPFSFALPAFSILTLNAFTKAAIGALTGFDNASVFAGECRAPDRDLPRSVMAAAPLIAAIYIFGTGAMLAYEPPDNVDLAAPLPQIIQAGFGNSGIGGVLTTAAVCVLTFGVICAWMALLGMVARFSMVIAWDRLLPSWWSQLHPRFRTPVNALLIVTGAMLAVALITSFGGAGGQEIVQIGSNGGIACLCIYYALLFSVVVFGRFPVAIRLAALCGFLVCITALPFQLLPLPGVKDQFAFALKVGGLILALNGTGAWLYWRGAKHASAVL
jgi:amino acid transporter